jgi:hypothetical protein
LSFGNELTLSPVHTYALRATLMLILLSLRCPCFSIAAYSDLAINDKHTCL